MPQQRALYLRVGALVLTGLALAIGFLVFLTSGRFGRDVVVYETYIRESVQGLDVGAPVKYRGVALGRVTEIGLASATYRAPQGEAFEDAFQLVLVRFDVNLERVGESAPELDKAVEQGFRVRLASQGLTGLAYLELDYLAPSRFPVRPPPWRPRYPWIPAVPSTVAQVQNAAEILLQKLQEVDLGGLIGNVGAFVADLRAQTAGGDLATALHEAAALARRLNEALEAADLAGTTRELRGVASDARAVLAGPELRGTLQNASQAMAGLRNATARLPRSLDALETTLRHTGTLTGDVQAELAPILRDLRAAVANLRETTETLRRSPSQAIFGAPPPRSR